MTPRNQIICAPGWGSSGWWPFEPPPGFCCRGGRVPDTADTVVSLCWRHFSPERVCVKEGVRHWHRSLTAGGSERGARRNVQITAQNPRFHEIYWLTVGADGRRETSNVRRLFLQALSEALLDCVNQSLFALLARTLGKRLVLIYKF